MLRMTIRNEDCVILRNEIKRNNAEKQFFYCVALRFLPFTIRNEDCAVLRKKQAQYCAKTRFSGVINIKIRNNSIYYIIKFSSFQQL